MAAAFNKLKAQAHAHPIYGSKRYSKPPPINEEQRDREKQFVLDYDRLSLGAEPDQNHVDIKRTQLGASSKNLRVQDFELVKTLGTGICARNELVAVQN
jgi:protein kinase A